MGPIGTPVTATTIAMAPLTDPGALWLTRPSERQADMAYVDPEDIAPGPDGFGGLRMPSPGMGGWGAPPNPRKPPLQPDDNGGLGVPEWLPMALSLMLKRGFGGQNLQRPPINRDFMPLFGVRPPARRGFGRQASLMNPLELLLMQLNGFGPDASGR